MLVRNTYADLPPSPKQKKYPCGDWTPKGNLGNIHYDARSREPLSSSTAQNDFIQSCSSSEVGQDVFLRTDELYCHPDVNAFKRQNPILALDLQMKDPSLIQPQFSIISPSHNVQNVLQRTAPTLCNTTLGLWEVIFVLDGCHDESLQVLREVLLSDSCLQSSMVRARVIISPTGVYETSSDNIGYTLANPSHFYIEVQSDMILVGHGWNLDMSRPCFQFADIFSVSGRCGHSAGPGSQHYSIGRCREDVEHTSETLKIETKNGLYVTATNNRGPILYRADALKKLGYLDEVNFYLNNDDHDLNRRANFYGWLASYKYVDFYAPLNLSPQRNDKLLESIPVEIKEYNYQYAQFRKNQGSKTCGDHLGIPPYPIYSIQTPTNYEYRDLPPVTESEWWDIAKKGHLEQSSALAGSSSMSVLLPPLPKLIEKNDKMAT